MQEYGDPQRSHQASIHVFDAEAIASATCRGRASDSAIEESLPCLFLLYTVFATQR